MRHSKVLSLFMGSIMAILIPVSAKAQTKSPAPSAAGLICSYVQAYDESSRTWRSASNGPINVSEGQTVRFRADHLKPGAPLGKTGIRKIKLDFFNRETSPTTPSRMKNEVDVDHFHEITPTDGWPNEFAISFNNLYRTDHAGNPWLYRGIAPTKIQLRFIMYETNGGATTYTTGCTVNIDFKMQLCRDTQFKTYSRRLPFEPAVFDYYQSSENWDYSKKPPVLPQMGKIDVTSYASRPIKKVTYIYRDRVTGREVLRREMLTGAVAGNPSTYRYSHDSNQFWTTFAPDVAPTTAYPYDLNVEAVVTDISDSTNPYGVASANNNCSKSFDLDRQRFCKSSLAVSRVSKSNIRTPISPTTQALQVNPGEKIQVQVTSDHDRASYNIDTVSVALSKAFNLDYRDELNTAPYFVIDRLDSQAPNRSNLHYWGRLGALPQYYTEFQWSRFRGVGDATTTNSLSYELSYEDIFKPNVADNNNVPKYVQMMNFLYSSNQEVTSSPENTCIMRVQRPEITTSPSPSVPVSPSGSPRVTASPTASPRVTPSPTSTGSPRVSSSPTANPSQSPGQHSIRVNTSCEGTDIVTTVDVLNNNVLSAFFTESPDRYVLQAMQGTTVYAEARGLAIQNNRSRLTIGAWSRALISNQSYVFRLRTATGGVQIDSAAGRIPVCNSCETPTQVSLVVDRSASMRKSLAVGGGSSELADRTYFGAQLDAFKDLTERINRISNTIEANITVYPGSDKDYNSPSISTRDFMPSRSILSSDRKLAGLLPFFTPGNSSYLTMSEPMSGGVSTCIECALNRSRREFFTDARNKFAILISDGDVNLIQYDNVDRNRQNIVDNDQNINRAWLAVTKKLPPLVDDGKNVINNQLTIQRTKNAATLLKDRGVQIFVLGYEPRDVRGADGRVFTNTEQTLKSIASTGSQYYKRVDDPTRWDDALLTIQRNICAPAAIVAGSR